jgi:hypothetical protein
VTAEADLRAVAAVDAASDAFLCQLEKLDAATTELSQPEAIGVLAESARCIARLVASNRVLAAAVTRLASSAPKTLDPTHPCGGPVLQPSPPAPVAPVQKPTAGCDEARQLDAAASLASSNKFLLSRVEELQVALAAANAENARLRSRQAAMEIAAGTRSDDAQQLQLVCGNAIRGLAVALANVHARQ